jgi:hypothetical protein
MFTGHPRWKKFTGIPREVRLRGREAEFWSFLFQLVIAWENLHRVLIM